MGRLQSRELTRSWWPSLEECIAVYGRPNSARVPRLWKKRR